MMEPTVIVRIEFDDGNTVSYELGEDSDKEIIGLIRKYGVLLKPVSEVFQEGEPK